MKDQADLRRSAGAKYRRNHRSWITDPQLTTTFTLGTPTEQQALADPDAVATWAAGWRRWHPPEGASLEWVVRNWPSWGRQTLPARVRVISPDAVAELAGQGQVWQRGQQIAAELRSHWSDSAYLGHALPRLVDDVTALDDADIQRLLAMTDWLVDHPEPGLMPRQVAVHGRGYAVVQLDRVGWIRGAAILYSGDLDTHGFNILSRCRSRLPHTRSVLMDSAALGEFRELAVAEPAQAHGVTGLTSAESATYREIEQGRLRLEQERIPMGAVGVLRSALAVV